MMIRPKVVCLCGSTRFVEEFRAAALNETLAGNIVLTVGSMTHSDDEHFRHLDSETRRLVKLKLDRLHFHKIDLSDEILVLNKCQHVGESTQAEVAYAYAIAKPIRWLETPRFWDSLSDLERFKICAKVLGEKTTEFYKAGILTPDDLDTGVKIG